ncbi:hypothetical protein CALVIDRAFT_563863 [Calocera viscosa TUFC12733]|uniref:tRNA (guanine(37)-N1)-methyltransferase n=1 Tax=Calocera viscosa (strain TUFC12733) TaxID=1330018 RepID=A0A167M5W8_CALVF|nr:hypothetical protein CALVIDRAFT_563863 [Calocera viscosa TUFC12733]
MAVDISPPVVPVGVLDKEKFTKTVTTLAASIPVKKIAEVRASKIARSAILEVPRITPVVAAFGPKADHKLLLLSSNKEEDIDAEALAFIKERASELVEYDVQLSYDYWNAGEPYATMRPNQILNAVLPEHIVVPTAYTSAGHIIHLNLREHQLPYKYLIGEVLLSKARHMKTVVNKTDRIHAQFRYFEMELLAGEPDYVVEANEHGVPFSFDYREVYFNTRLDNEHARIVEKFQPNEVICDVMGGVGPFSIPAAKKGCAVLLNDLNPNAIKWARFNITKNKVEDLIRLYEIDGVDFIRKSVVDLFKEPFPAWEPPRPISRRELLEEWKRTMQRQGKWDPSRAPKSLRDPPRSPSPSTHEEPSTNGVSTDPRPQHMRFVMGPTMAHDGPSPSRVEPANERPPTRPASPSKRSASPSIASTNPVSRRDTARVPMSPSEISPPTTSPMTSTRTAFAGPFAPSSSSSRSLSTQAESPAAPLMDRRTPSHYILNLPSTALLFLFAFRGFLRPIMETHIVAQYYGPDKNMPMIHVYCFTTELEPEAMKLDVLRRASNALNYRLTLDMPELEVCLVRKVAPTKTQCSLSFRLPWQVAIERVSNAEINLQKKDLDRVHLEMDAAPDDIDAYEEDEDASTLSNQNKRRFRNVDMI